LVSALLTVADAEVRIGASVIVRRLSLQVAAAETVCLLGRNGAGKTTTIRAIMGTVPLIGGSLSFAGRDLTSAPAYQRAIAGIAWAPQDRRLFRDLSVAENLAVASRFTRRHVDSGAWTEDRLYALFPKLAERRRQPAGLLSGGEQRMLAIARALVTNPKLLLLDEVTDGLAPIVVEQFFDTVRDIAAAGMAILLAEQNIHFAAALAGRGYLIDKGTIRAEGRVSSLLADEALVASHLAL
jgi:branched-chain amino acid transport system ATP-binding protein